MSENYYYLKKGEIIQKGDECDAAAGWNDAANWKPAPSHMIGRACSDPAYPAHTVYRRLVKKSEGG